MVANHPASLSATRSVSIMCRVHRIGFPLPDWLRHMPRYKNNNEKMPCRFRQGIFFVAAQVQLISTHFLDPVLVNKREEGFFLNGPAVVKSLGNTRALLQQIFVLCLSFDPLGNKIEL